MASKVNAQGASAAKGSNMVAIITMFFIFAMISFVTNMAAPFGNIWGFRYDWAGMAGNLMNFVAYLFMGIPAGNMLIKYGYKKTALIALAVGAIGLAIQLASGYLGAGETALYVYLLGAFVCGLCVCMLNTVVNPMLNLLGGGGNRGNQFIQIGGSCNSCAGTLTPLFVGMLIGQVTAQTAMTDVLPLIYIAICVFVLAFLIIAAVNIPEPHLAAAGKAQAKFTHSPWSFRHFVLGAVSIFFYVGIEVGIPGILIFYISSLDIENATAVAGGVAAVYWLLMFVGRLCSSVISGKVSSRMQLLTVSLVGMILVIGAIVLPSDIVVSVPSYSVEEGFTTAPVPASAMLLVLCGLCTSVMWGGIFNLAVEGLGKYTAKASGIFMMMVVGGGVMPMIQEAIGRSAGYMTSYWLVVAMLAYLFFYAVSGSKNVNTNIPVDEEMDARNVA